LTKFDILIIAIVLSKRRSEIMREITDHFILLTDKIQNAVKT